MKFFDKLYKIKDKDAQIQFLALVNEYETNPHPLKGYMAVKISAQQLKNKMKLSTINVAKNNAIINEKGFIQILRGNIYILGELHDVSTILGSRAAEVWYCQESLTTEKEEIELKPERKNTDRQKEISSNTSKLKDFYYEVYVAIFNEKPVITNFAIPMKALKTMFSNQDITLSMTMASIVSYLNLEEDFFKIKTKQYPLEQFPKYLPQCRTIVKEYFKWFKGTEEEYYQEYITKILKRYNISLNDDGGIIKNRR